jgi:hypothetical protein
MTKYEKVLAEGLPPMNALEWMLLEVACEDVINDNQLPGDKYWFKELWMEIEHLYKDEPEKLNLIYENIYL